jgi:ABC-type lipoprotein export system ATPase subunit
MTDARTPLLEIVGLEKSLQGLPPLRIGHLAVAAGDRYVLGGFDAALAETFVHLVTGALLPDAGEIRVAGRNTRDIATDTEWLASLDRFGIVTERAVLLEAMTAAANLALPLTLAIDPMPADILARVHELAAHAGLAAGRLTTAASALSPEERVRVHLGRALAVHPQVLLLEHPTSRLDPRAAEALGVTIRQVAESDNLAWLALTNDEAFARAAGGTRLRLKASTGQLAKEGFWKRRFTAS